MNLYFPGLVLQNLGNAFAAKDLHLDFLQMKNANEQVTSNYGNTTFAFVLLNASLSETSIPVIRRTDLHVIQ